ncbi:cytochrome c oxidase assembly factor CtaG [Oceanobacillus sp. J11TS1]|uniref:cytochrome c oxidase assembly factor CtaG n=1 Tax=Oceanobacillus sp. J11TS1 TaxID=2807191 RepID=UPI001B18EAF0|nr:cytochrome c oxidase assembly factor CtaG [Oceanobacillus sp. J11TS1]GIO22326.1 protein CtaG [Oceanobacillus sp. J11TS1]
MWLDIQIFGFRALWSPYFMIFIVLIAAAYFLITGSYRQKIGDDDKASVKQQVSFYTALLCLYLVKGSPIDLLSHITLTAHMIQMAIFLLVVPILMIKGIPEWIWRKVIEQPIIKPIVRIGTRPLVSLLLFNGLFSIYHIPSFFEFAKSSSVLHFFVHGLLFIAAFFMWFPLISPLKEFDRLQPLLKIGYIFVNSVLITPACVLIIFAPEALYTTYTQGGAWIQALSLCVPTDVLQGLTPGLTGPEMFTPISILEDQQLGGIVMKIMQEITYGIILGTIIFTWFRGESNKVDPLPPTTAETH